MALCKDCSLPYVACTKCVVTDHCDNCGASPPRIEVITPAVEVISSAPNAPTRKVGNSMLSKLREAQTEAQQAISEINDKIEELQNAIYELERFEESVTEVIDTIEGFDGTEVSVDIESFSVDLSVDL